MSNHINTTDVGHIGCSLEGAKMRDPNGDRTDDSTLDDSAETAIAAREGNGSAPNVNLPADPPQQASGSRPPLDDRMRYWVVSQIDGKMRGELFFELGDVQRFAATHISENGLRLRDIYIMDSFSNVRTWSSLSKKSLKFSRPRLDLSQEASIMISRYLEWVHKVKRLDQVKMGPDGTIYLSDPLPEAPDHHRILGTVDEMLRDFVKRWNASLQRTFPKDSPLRQAPESEHPRPD